MLEEHLLVCLECRMAVREYELVARLAMPSLVADFPTDLRQLPEGWSEEGAKQEFFRQLELRESSGSGDKPYVKHKTSRAQRESHPWWNAAAGMLPYAAGVAFVALIGLIGYQLGTKRRADPAPVTQQRPAPDVNGLRREIIALSDQRQSLRARIEDRDREIANLTSKTTRQVAEIQELKNEDHAVRDSVQKVQEEKAQTASERDELSHKLEQAQSDLTSTQKGMESLREQRATEAARIVELETRLGQLPDLLKDRDATIEQQRELLARDRDIRDLMGARDLYVADVSDVGRDGKTKKPFGRVFYTKGKSLIFYAYDLDQHPGLREASTFQAWGQRGPDVSQAMSLGIFYADNTAHQRWVLKFNNSTSLDQIDAVFVTVEPKGGSRKPSGKQFLFAYLRVEPNHP